MQTDVTVHKILRLASPSYLGQSSEGFPILDGPAGISSRGCACALTADDPVRSYRAACTKTPKIRQHSRLSETLDISGGFLMVFICDKSCESQ